MKNNSLIYDELREVIGGSNAKAGFFSKHKKELLITGGVILGVVAVSLIVVGLIHIVRKSDWYDLRQFEIEPTKEAQKAKVTRIITKVELDDNGQEKVTKLKCESVMSVIGNDPKDTIKQFVETEIQQNLSEIQRTRHIIYADSEPKVDEALNLFTSKCNLPHAAKGKWRYEIYENNPKVIDENGDDITEQYHPIVCGLQGGDVLFISRSKPGLVDYANKKARQVVGKDTENFEIVMEERMYHAKDYLAEHVLNSRIRKLEVWK